MDVDIDMDVPYSVSVFLIRRHLSAPLHLISEGGTSTYASPLPAFIPNAENCATHIPELWVDISTNSIMVFRDTADTM